MSRMAHVLCVLALLCFALCAAENTETAARFKDLQDSLPWLNEFEDNQELTENLLQLLYKMSKSENGNNLRGPGGAEKEEKKRRVLERTGLTTPARRFGCRVFFWKSWTAC